jgi:hypothetical protein
MRARPARATAEYLDSNIANSWMLMKQNKTLAGRKSRAELCRALTKQDSLADWSEALASGASPQLHVFEPTSCHSLA